MGPRVIFELSQTLTLVKLYSCEEKELTKLDKDEYWVHKTIITGDQILELASSK